MVPGCQMPFTQSHAVTVNIKLKRSSKSSHSPSLLTTCSCCLIVDTKKTSCGNQNKSPKWHTYESHACFRMDKKTKASPTSCPFRNRGFLFLSYHSQTWRSEERSSTGFMLCSSLMPSHSDLTSCHKKATQLSLLFYFGSLTYKGK